MALVWLHEPLAHVATHLTTDYGQQVTTDYYHFYWNYWWMRHAFSNGLDVYFTNYVFAPHVSNLSLHTLTPFWYPVWALLEPLFGTVAAMNGVFFVALLLNGVVMHAFLRGQGASHGLALVGGLLLQGSELMFFSLRWTTVNLMGWFWLPLVVMLWQRGLNHRGAENTEGGGNSNSLVLPKRELRTRILWSMLLGITLWAMILTDLQYGVFLALLFLPVVGWSLWRGRRQVLQIVLYGALALGVALLLLWLAGPLQPLLAYDRSLLASTPMERATHVEFPLGYIWRGAQDISFGVLLLPLVVIGGWLLAMGDGRKREDAVVHDASRSGHLPSWLWLATAVLPLLLSAGGSVSIAGIDVPMPYQIVHALLGGTFRYPERFTNVFLIAGLAFALPVISRWLAQRGQNVRAAVVAALVLAVLLDARVFASVPLQPIPPRYAFYEAMGREAHDYVVLEVPTAGASGEGIVGRGEWAAAQWYGAIHGKRMVNGHLSRVPPWVFLYMETDDAMLSWLGQRRWLAPEVVRAQMIERIEAFPMGYIVLHTNWLPQDGPTLQEIVGFFNQQDDLLCPMWIEAGAIVYRTRWHPDGCPARTPPELTAGVYEIDIGGADDARYIGWGWHYAEPVGGILWRWTGEYPRIGGDVMPADGHLYADLYVDLPPNAYSITINAQSFETARLMTVYVNGVEVGSSLVQPGGLQPYAFAVPAMLIGDGQHVAIRLAYDDAPAMGARRLALAVDNVRIESAD
jgi:hypothetical protein